MGNEQDWTVKMSEVWKAFGLRDRACKRSNIIAATSSRREVSRRLYGVFREEKVVNGSNWHLPTSPSRRTPFTVLRHLFCESEIETGVYGKALSTKKLETLPRILFFPREAVLFFITKIVEDRIKKRHQASSQIT
jgi:hypothetical protein